MDIRHNEKEQVFFIPGDTDVAGKLTYILKDNVMTVNHTFTDPNYRGRGYAKELVLASIDYAKENNYKIKPTCSYAYKVTDETAPELIIR